MPQAVHNPLNVMVGNAKPFYAPVGTAMVADTLAIGELWPTPWVYPGATEEGLTFGGDQDIQDHYVEEQPNQAARTLNRSSVAISFTCSEDTLENMKLSMGGGTITTTAAGTGVIGKQEFRFSSTLQNLAAGFEGRNRQGFWRRVYVPLVSSGGSAEEVAYRRSEAKRMYAVTLTSLCPVEDIIVRDMTAIAL